jgi:endoglucanase
MLKLVSLLTLVFCCLAYAVQSQAPSTVKPLFALDQPLTFAYVSWEKRARIEGGRVVLREAGMTGQGGAGMGLASPVNLTPFADSSPGLRLRVGPKNGVKTLRLFVKDEAGATGEWDFAMPAAGGEAVLVTPQEGAPLSMPNRLGDPERTPNLARIREWQIIGDWSNVPIDAEVEAIVAVPPDAAIRTARAGRAQREKEAQEAAIRAEEELRKKYPSNADLRRVSPVTNRILVLHFREGSIQYGGVRPDGKFAPQGENRVHYAPMDIKAATDPARYQITSADDAAYAKPARPLRLGYKAKGNDFNNPYTVPQFLRDYWVYAELPAPLQTGRTYTIELGKIAGNLQRFRFTFDEKALRSPTIHTSHVGYKPDAPKYAYFSQWMGNFNSPDHPDGALNLAPFADTPVHIADAATGKVLKTYRGMRLQKSRTEPDLAQPNMTGADVYSVDFSDFRTPGRYMVVAKGIGASWPFEIGERVYEDAHRATLRSVFFQRRGIEKRMEEFDRVYPRSHHPDMNKFVYGKVHGEGGKIDDPRPVTDIWGWYGDAGDWDGYDSHYVVPYVLLLTHDLRPKHFRDGDTNNSWRADLKGPWIEEGKSGVPDILDEARWLIEFYRRARHELIRQGLGTGGVPGYVGRDAGAEAQPSWNDDRVLYISEERVDMAYAYAGAAAYYVHNLNKSHGKVHPDSAGWLAEARDAFRWAQARKDESENARRMRELAAACLYVATSEPEFQAIFKADWQWDALRNDGAWVGQNPNALASAIYLISGAEKPNLDKELHAQVRASMITRADNVTDNNERVGFRLGGLEGHQAVRMNLITVPRVFFQIVAHELTGAEKYRRSIHNTLAYVFGGNQEGRSRLTGIGHESEQDAFVPDAWYLLDLNHKVYRNPIFPGHSAYGLLSGWDVGGPGSESWARTSTLPLVDRWPVGEQRMRSRYSIAGSEWTISQNHPWYALATGYLLPTDNRPLPPFRRPTVALKLAQNEIDLARPMRLAATTSDATERVEYYFEWRFIGESTDRKSGFAFVWDPSQTELKAGDEVQITAVAYDKRGEISLPSPKGERTLKVTGRPVGSRL